MVATNRIKRMGLIAVTKPSIRDYTPDTESVAMQLSEIDTKLISKDGIIQTSTNLNAEVDHKKTQTPVPDQGNLGSCTAFSRKALIEGMLKKSTKGKTYDLSALYIYYATRRGILGWTGDTGAYMRSSMEAIIRFGAPPTDKWQYKEGDFEIEPDWIATHYADDFKANKFFRLDSYPYLYGESILKRVKEYLSKGFIMDLGFDCYDSLFDSKAGEIPFPSVSENIIGGHAVLITGYNDNVRITNRRDGKFTMGCLYLKNSWGSGWGDEGYGYLPYDYILKGLAGDIWTITSQSIVDSGKFG